MSLYNGIDPTAIASFGVYTETYGAGEEGNIANLVASFGLLEAAPGIPEASGWIGFIQWFWEFF